MTRVLAAALGLALALPLAAHAAPPAPPTSHPQTEADAYTRYELLDPGSGKFHILYEVTATTPGAVAYYNPIRPGSTATGEHVLDRATGKPLEFKVVSGKDALAQGLSDADPKTDYIRVALARPVPADGGQGRILIDKTYEDRKSYYSAGGPDLVFERPLGIKRNAVVLPQGYELVACNYPSQVIQQADGRIVVSFWNGTPAEAPLKLRARLVTPFGAWLAKGPDAEKLTRVLDERAHQNRDIVYFLKPPETHAFALYHDYTEARAGAATYVNVVRDGSTVQDPGARNLDTGEVIPFAVLKGEAITRANLDADDRPAKITPASEVVVFHFTPVPAGGSTRLRMSETYTDPDSYKVVDGQLVFHRSFGRAADAVVLPQGWMLTNSSVPATVSETDDGRERLDFVNPRNDEIDVVITARKR
jgi:hypothetical protein